eukprot:11291746-Alexandrium_andersonii.AAC.1
MQPVEAGFGVVAGRRWYRPGPGPEISGQSGSWAVQGWAQSCLLLHASGADAASVRSSASRTQASEA